MKTLTTLIAIMAALTACNSSSPTTPTTGLKTFPTVELLYRSGGGREPDLAAEIASEWSQCLGVDVQAAGMPMDQWLARVLAQHDFDVTLDAWQGDYPQSHTFAGLWHSQSSMNNGGYANPEYDRLIEAGLAQSGEQSNRSYQEAERLIYDDTAVAPLFFTTRTHVVRPEWTGINPNALMRHGLEYVRPSQSGVDSGATYFGGAQRKVEGDRTFHYMAGGQPRSCDPQLMTSLTEDSVVSNVHQGLLKWGPDGSNVAPLPAIARSWDVSEDGTVYTFHLRDEARWSNGEPITAHDFQWAWERAVSPELEAGYATLFGEIGYVSSRAIDDHTFEVTLKAPSAVFLVNLPMPIFFPLHRATVETYGEAWCQPQHIVSSGPFRVTEAVISDHITLERNPYYWNVDQVWLERAINWASSDNALNIDMYRTGQRDWIGTQVAIPADQLSELRRPDGSLTVADGVTYATLSLSYISFNQREGHEHWQDPRVRMAFSLAMDRPAMEQYVLRNGDIPTRHPFPPGMGDYQPIDVPAGMDCDRAKSLLHEAGWATD